MPRTRTRLVTPRSCLGTLALVVVAVPVVLWLVYLRNNASPNLVIPTPVMPANNAYFDFLRAAQIAGAIKHKAPADMMNSPTTHAGYLAVCKACTADMQPALAVMRRGFDKPFMLPAVRTASNPVFPTFALFRELEREISGVEEYYEMTGQPARAADAALDGAEVGVMLPRGGPLIADLVAIACQAISLRRLELLLPKLNAAELARVAARLERISAKRVPYSDIVIEEGWTDAAMFEETLRDPKVRGMRGSFEMAENLEDSSDKRSRMDRYRKAARFALADKGQMVHANLAYFRALAAEARRPFTGRSSVPLPNNLFADIYGDLFAINGRKSHLRGDAILDLLRVQTALYRYKAAHGRFPQRLSDLAPAYLASVPADPFGVGKPFAYRARSGGAMFLLYSIGPDMKDDGGRPARFPSAEDGGDIVAGQMWQHGKLDELLKQ